MKKIVDRVVLNAEQRSDAARAQLMTTVTTLRNRLDPRVIVAESAEALMARANLLLDTAESTVKNRAVVSGASAIAFIAAVVMRVWLAKRKTHAGDETSGAVDS